MKKKLKAIYKKGKKFVGFGTGLISTASHIRNSNVNYLNSTYNHVAPKEELREVRYINRELTNTESLLDSNRQVVNVQLGSGPVLSFSTKTKVEGLKVGKASFEQIVPGNISELEALEESDKVHLTKNASNTNKKYLTDELANINKIEEVSLKSQNEKQDFEIEVVPKKGHSSIYALAFQTWTVTKKKYPSIKIEQVPFNFKDARTGARIPQSTMLAAFLECTRKSNKLPRVIEKSDTKIKIGSDFFEMFRKQYETVFGYNLVVEENVPKTANRNRVKRAKKRLFKTYGESAKLQLRKLFENPCTVKCTGCRYRDYKDDVTIYYDLFSDLFAIVGSESNKLIGFSIATELDYVDIFRYKSIFQQIAARESELSQSCAIEDSNSLELKCPIEQGPFRKNIPLTEEDKSLTFDNFNKVLNKGLPENYDIVDGWWLDRQKEILRSLDNARYAQLSIEFKASGPTQNVITELEALVVLQAELENLVSGSSRPDMINIPKEKKLDFDFKILSWNQEVFKGWKPTYVDIKSPLDPEVIRARNQPEQSLEDQVDNLLKTISDQRQRAIENDESVIHLINLLRIKPSERAYFMTNFKTKALEQNLDLNGVKFMNTSSNTI